MGDLARRGAVNELNLASRRAEEAALRRFQAVHWLDYLVGPLGISSQPSEKEFISCLRNGLILCKILNIVKAGSVSKVIENNNVPSQSLPWECQPLPAYQYFENVRNFLVAMEELRLPVFDASVFERENLEEGSSSKVVDCILALKAYHEWKQMTGGNGVYRPPRSPLVAHSSTKSQVRTPRRLDLSEGSEKPITTVSEVKSLEDTLIKALAERMVGAKENMDINLLSSYRNGDEDSVKVFNKILLSCFEDQCQETTPEMKSGILGQLRKTCSTPTSTGVPFADLSNLVNQKSCKSCLGKGRCNHWNLVKQQEKELLNIKSLLSSTKQDFKILQSQLQSDLKQLGDQVLQMSNAANGYNKVVQENRNLYNMVQDLKGNIRVYCRVRPMFRSETPNIVDFIGADGSLVVADPTRPQKDGKKLFQFNRIFGPMATQDEVFRDTQPLIRSVMDGYNVCIFAYGQTGSGKTHTMSGGSDKELGVSYLALNDLFELSSKRKHIVQYEIKVQMVEIYNEQVRDLLADDSAATRLEIRSCASENSLALPEAKLLPVKSTVDVINLMKLGDLNRAVGSTAINFQSSRSHSILTVHVQGEDVSGSKLRSCLNLVDLAGSERVDKSEVSGDGLKEAQYINKSLSCLGDVITALAQKNSHIPYRNSKLTLLLQNSLGGNAKTLMFAHVSPEGCSFGETISTLKFAQRVSTVELGAARANKESTEVLELKAQIESLKKQLASKEVQTPQTKKPKVAEKTPLVNPRPVATEKTPPRSRRLSIENGTSIMPVHRSINYEEKKGAKTPTAVTRSRRMSLEGPRKRNVEKDSDQNNFLEGVSNPIDGPHKSPTRSSELSPMARIDRTTSRSPLKSLVAKPDRNTLRSPMTKPDRNTSIVTRKRNAQMDHDQNNLLEVISGQMDAPPKSPIRSSAPKSPIMSKIGKTPSTTLQVAPSRSPTNYGLRSSMVKIDTAMRVPSIQVAKTPIPQMSFRSEVVEVQKNECKISSETQTQGKGGSHIRKSLRTIGRFINGSEKRTQQKPIEVSTPITTTSSVTDMKSPVSSNARALRRRSLTGLQPEKSRRTSLGGVSTDSYGNESANARTPPQVCDSATSTKRWH